MAVVAQVVEVASLTAEQRDSMFEILSAYFEGAIRWVFDKDLDEKDGAVVLTDTDLDRVCGFSTLRLIEDEVQGVPIRSFFSGDTIIDRAYWGCMALEKAWMRFTFSHALDNPDYRYFWFLIVNSYRSFRYLPVYAKNYYPHPEREMPPFERTVLDQLATKRYGSGYDPIMGVIRLEHRCPLRPGVANIGEQELRDPRIAFFEKCNPEWRDGAELACLTEFSLDNVNPAAMRVLNGLLAPVC